MNTQRVEGHTPTPWTLDADRDRIIAPRPESEDNWIICEMGGSCENPSVLSDAVFIVHAVNNIERLEKVNEALVEALGRIAHFGNDTTSPLFGGDAMRMREIARDALAKEPA